MDDAAQEQPRDRQADAGRRDGERVEERLEEWGRRAGRFLAVAAARAREGAEDILAEAQSVKRGERK